MSRVIWDTYTSVTVYGVSAMATVRGTSWRALASAEVCLAPPTEWGVPLGIPQDNVLRFSRVVSTPKGKGGGSAVLQAVLRLCDDLGRWTVLEANPYPGQDEQALWDFYGKHGFLHHPAIRSLMLRGPGRIIQ